MLVLCFSYNWVLVLTVEYTYVFLDCLNEIDAQRVVGYALYKDGRDAKLPYPLENFNSDVAGRSFHNGRFIQRMREKTASLPK